ncbi:hypothetical protein Tco_0489596 [Tanacetum coccineum]
MVDFMIVEDISLIIDPRLSQVVLGRPFIEISNITNDLPEGVVRFTNKNNEVAYKIPHKIEQYNSLSDLEKEHTKSVYLRNKDDKRRGVNFVMSKILGFYKECLELGPKYVTGLDDEGEVSVCGELDAQWKFVPDGVNGGRFTKMGQNSGHTWSKKRCKSLGFLKVIKLNVEGWKARWISSGYGVFVLFENGACWSSHVSKSACLYVGLGKGYPVHPATITKMLNKKLQADHWNEMCYQLLKLITMIVGIKRLLDDLRVTAAQVCVTTASTKICVTTASTKIMKNMISNMDQDSAHMVVASKVPMLKPGEYELWRMRIEQYIQMVDYSLWEVIKNGKKIENGAKTGVIGLNLVKFNFTQS